MISLCLGVSVAKRGVSQPVEELHHGLAAKLRLKPPRRSQRGPPCGEGRDASAPSTSGESLDGGRCAAVWENDVGTDRMTGVFSEKYHHRNLWQEGPMTPNIADIIRHDVSLEVRCIDRVYLHAYMPKLQTSGGLCYFLHDYLGHPVPSPALFKPRHDRFIAAIEKFAAGRHVPLVSFEHVDSKDAFVAPYRARFTAREGVVVIGVAQEKMRSFKAHKRPGHGHTPVFDFSRQSVAVNHYYFYVQDRDWGPAFLKIEIGRAHV